MVTFKGTYNYAIDHKGRVNVPAKFRGAPDHPDSEHYVVARGFEGCLYIYPKESWLIVEKRLHDLRTMSDAKARYFIRTLLSNAADVKTDKQGRVAIPQNLLDLASIKKEVIIRGVLDKLEIWDPEILKNYEDGQPDSYEDIAGQLLI